MDQSNLQIVVTAQDQASSTLAAIAGNAAAAGEKASTGLAGIGKTIQANSAAIKTAALDFGIAGGAITGVLAISVKAAADAQAKLANLHATLAAMGRDTPQVAGAILDAANATIKLGFDNEDSALSITKFYQRTKDMTTALTLSQTAMDLARSKNIDLATATNLVNLALSGSGRALLQYGIHIKDAATPLEALGELQDAVKGQSQAFSKTFEGQSEVMRASFQQLEQTVGAELLPLLASFLGAVNKVVFALRDWTSAHPELTKWVVIITAALGVLLTIVGGALGLVAVIGSAITAFGIIGPLLAGLALGPIAIVSAAILAIIVVIGYWIVHWTDLRDTVIWVWDGIVAKVQEAWDAIKGIFQAAVTWISDTILAPLEKTIDSILNKVSSIKGGVTSAASSLGSAITNAPSNIAWALGLSGRAGGGPVSANVPYLVGERGPEIFMPAMSGQISPNGGYGAGSLVINMNGGTYLDEGVAKRIGDMIISQFRRINKL